MSFNTSTNYIALDLELNNARNNATPNPKIIQVGIAVGSWDHYVSNTIETRKWYIDPQEPIYPFITELTGITDEHIANFSVPHHVVAEEIQQIVEAGKCFTNPITWGGGDTKELINEFKERNIEFRCFGRRWFDTKTIHTYNRLLRGTSSTGGLGKTLPKYGIQFEGTPHRADVDAYNTLRLFFAMVSRQNKLENMLDISKTIL